MSLTALITFRAPPELIEALNRAASREMISRSDYVRRAALRAVQQDDGPDALRELREARIPTN
jgi:uncharacterized protein (DUF1778 family)